MSFTLLGNLVAHWKHDEYYGTRYDSHKSNDLIDIRTVKQAEGTIDWAAQFNPSELPYLFIENSPSLNLGFNNFTLTTWVYLNSKPVSGDAFVIYKGSFHDDEYWLKYSSELDLFQFYFKGAGTTTASSFGSPQTGTWNFISVSLNTTGQLLTLQVNQQSNTSVCTTGLPTDGDFSIGSANQVNGPLDGKVQLTGIWSRELNNTQLLTLYSSGFGLKYNQLTADLSGSLISYWNLDEPEGYNRTDPKGTNNLVDLFSTYAKPGILQQASEFRLAKGSVLRVPTTSDLEIGNQSFAITAWVYFNTKANSYDLVRKVSDDLIDEYKLYYHWLTDEIIFEVFNEDNPVWVAAPAPEIEDWTFISARYNKQNAVISIQVGSGSVYEADCSYGPSPAQTTGYFYIGAPEIFDGLIDSVSIWKRSTSRSENTRLYNFDSGLDYPFDWPFDIYTSERYLPIDWIPRWQIPNYRLESTFRLWYVFSLINPKTDIVDITRESIRPYFFGRVSQPRLGYVAQYHGPKNLYHEFEVRLFVPLGGPLGPISVQNVKKADTIGTFLAEAINPIYYIDEHNYYLRNLAATTISTTTSSGVLNLKALLENDPAIEDSPFVLTDSYGDKTYLDQIDGRFDGERIFIARAGTYSIQYLSQSIHSKILAGTAYLTINSDTVAIFTKDFTNVWDQAAEWFIIKRRPSETNVKLKQRSQHLALATTVDQRIAASLGVTKAHYWDTEFTSLVPSGTINFSVLATPQNLYIEEFPLRDGDNFILSYVPSGSLQLFYNQTKVEPDCYSVVGSEIIPSSSVLRNADNKSVMVNYTTKQFLTLTASGYYTAIVPLSIRKDQRLYLTSHKVKINSSLKRIKMWYWDKDEGVLEGGAVFY